MERVGITRGNPSIEIKYVERKQQLCLSWSQEELEKDRMANMLCVPRIIMLEKRSQNSANLAVPNEEDCQFLSTQKPPDHALN